MAKFAPNAASIDISAMLEVSAVRGWLSAFRRFRGQEGFEELNPKRQILLTLTFAAGTALPEREELMEAYARFGNVESLKVLVETRSVLVTYEKDDEAEAAFRWSVSDCPFKFKNVANFCEWQGISTSLPSGLVEAGGGSASRAAAGGQSGQVKAGGSGSKAAASKKPVQVKAGGGWGSRAAAAGQLGQVKTGGGWGSRPAASGQPGQVKAGWSGSKAAASGQTQAGGGSGSRAAAGGGDDNAASLLKATGESLKGLTRTLESCYSVLNDEEKARLKKVIKKLEDEVTDAEDFAEELFFDTLSRRIKPSGKTNL